MGSSLSQRADLLRILLADDDDVDAFVSQCAINQLSKPCAFQRVRKREELTEQLKNFEPQFIVLAGSFASAGEVRQIKQLTNGHPIICLVETASQADASLKAGATDCVLRSQADQIGQCLENHYTGRFAEPYFHSAGNRVPKGKIAQAEYKLEQFDRKIGAWLRQAGREAQIRWREFCQAAKRGWEISQARAIKEYRAAKVRYLLHKQQRLVKTQAPVHATEQPRPAASNPAPLPSAADIFPSRTLRNELPIMEKSTRADHSLPAEPSYADQRSIGRDEVEDSQALCTLELSFKTLFHTSLDAMFLLDGLGSILHVNPAGCTLLGAAASDILGRSILSWVPETEKAHASAFWEALLIEGQQKSALTIENDAGHRSLFLSGRTNLWFGVHLLIARDRTELNECQRELAELRQGQPT